MLSGVTLILLLALGAGFVGALVSIIAKEMQPPQPHQLGPTRAELLAAQGFVQRGYS